ncbi:unnamed protein product [Allacma fusca]|uniref:Pre-C2HC domain-containing protein n=1 Tax=Allacma fusca TaxID=39272 RepID=A0A8J2P6Q5_9HEXA|nr:unnamed protein product [Allacma fusca]
MMGMNDGDPTYNQLTAMYSDIVKQNKLQQKQIEDQQRKINHLREVVAHYQAKSKEDENHLSEQTSSTDESEENHSNMTIDSIKSIQSKETYSEKLKKKRIPPIYVSGIKNITEFTAMLESMEECETPIMQTLSNGDVKIACSNEQSFRAVYRALEAIRKNPSHKMYGIGHHTYQLKQDKPYQVVIRGLHPSTSPEDIKLELIKIGHDAINVTNVIIKKTEVKKDESGEIMTVIDRVKQRTTQSQEQITTQKPEQAKIVKRNLPKNNTDESDEPVELEEQASLKDIWELLKKMDKRISQVENTQNKIKAKKHPSVKTSRLSHRYYKK